MYMCGESLKNIKHLYLYGRVTFKARLEAWRRMSVIMIYTLIDDSSQQGGDNENCSIKVNVFHVQHNRVPLRGWTLHWKPK